jgi:hypothetical protein
MGQGTELQHPQIPGKFVHPPSKVIAKPIEEVPLFKNQLDFSRESPDLK